MTQLHTAVLNVLGISSAAETKSPADDAEADPNTEATTESDVEETLGGRESTNEDIDIATDALLDTLPQPAFLIDTEHRIIGWNREMEVLTGIDRADVLGDDDTARFFRDDRTETLANAVVDDPDSADETFGAERSGRDQRAYQTRQELENAAGETLHITSVATPIYQRDELQGVMQLIQDDTDVIRRREAMTSLLSEATETADALDSGNLSARIKYTDDHDVLDPEVMGLIDAVNSMAESTEGMVSGLLEEVRSLSEAAAEIADTASEVDEDVTEQNDSLRSVSNELQDLSATMEEVAASSDQVAAAANQAEEAATSGAEAGRSAQAEMESVVSTTDDLVETVEALEERMEAVDEVVEIIAEIADETNMLALNASIEAARADEAGDGFEVVAEEVKNLANETKENAESISTQITDIKEQTGETVEQTEATNERVRGANEEIHGMLDALEGIVSASQEAADGIGEVADVNDEQAASVEEITAVMEDIDETADEINERVGTITDLTEAQRDDVGEMADYLDTLAGGDAVDQVVE